MYKIQSVIVENPKEIIAFGIRFIRILNYTFSECISCLQEFIVLQTNFSTMKKHMQSCSNKTGSSQPSMNDLKEVYYIGGIKESLHSWFINNNWTSRLPSWPLSCITEINSSCGSFLDPAKTFQCQLCISCFSNNNAFKVHSKSVHMLNSDVSAFRGPSIVGKPFKLINKNIRLQLHWDIWIEIFLREVSKTNSDSVPIISAAITQSKMISNVIKNYNGALDNLSKFSGSLNYSNCSDFDYFQLQKTAPIDLLNSSSLVIFKNNLIPEKYIEFLNKLGLSNLTSFDAPFYSVVDCSVLQRNCGLLSTNTSMIVSDDISMFYNYSMELVQQSDIFERSKCGI